MAVVPRSSIDGCRMRYQQHAPKVLVRPSRHLVRIVLALTVSANHRLRWRRVKNSVQPAAGAPAIALSPTAILFTSTVGAANPAAQTVSITNTGTGTLSGLATGSIVYGAGQPTGWPIGHNLASTSNHALQLGVDR